VEDHNPTFTATGPDSWCADGLMSLADIERAIGLEVPDELDANTLSGLFMQRLSRMPETGDSIVEGDYRLSVEAVADNRVGSVLVERTPAADSETVSSAG